MYFGEKVRQLRSERNLTQPQLAQAIGIEQSYLSKLENDKSVPSADIFQAILRAFAIDVPALLAGVDEKQVRSELRQVPEVAEFLKSKEVTRIHNIKAWLYASGVALTLGLTLGVAGYRGLLFSNEQFNYASAGLLKSGETPDFFDTYRVLLNHEESAGRITAAQIHERVLEVESRKSVEYLLLDEYRGQGFLERVSGGDRFYTFQRASAFERPQNRWLMFLGALLTFGGITGFIVESRLRGVRV